MLTINRNSTVIRNSYRLYVNDIPATFLIHCAVLYLHTLCYVNIPKLRTACLLGL